jgi:hypothetical protein
MEAYLADKKKALLKLMEFTEKFKNEKEDLFVKAHYRNLIMIQKSKLSFLNYAITQEAKNGKDSKTEKHDGISNDG